MHSGLNDLTVGLPHSEIPGSKLGYQLPWAYRRFLRPSSPLNAKTSTVCPFTLGHVDRMPSDRLASDRRSLTDAHAGPFCSLDQRPVCTRLDNACFQAASQASRFDTCHRSHARDGHSPFAHANFNHRVSCTCHRAIGFRQPCIARVARSAGPNSLAKAGCLSMPLQG